MINLDVLAKIAFKLGSFSVTWYAIIILSGALIGTIFGYFYYGKRLHFTGDLVSEGLAFGLLFGILGARLYYVAFSNQTYNGFLDVINPSNGGLAIHGGLIAVAIYLPIWCKLRKVDFITLIEIALPLIMFAQCVGRWGNFVNQEAYGPETSREFLKSLLIPNFIVDKMYINGAYHHPTFLYESVANLIGLTIYQIVRKFNKKLYVGDSISFYLIWYGLVRFFIEILRTDALLIGSSGIKIAQVVSILMIISGLTFFILRRVFKFKLITCYDALYSSSASLVINKDKTEKDKKNKVIVFDCDGTILDTFELIEKATLATFNELNPEYNISLEEAHSFFGPYVNDTFNKYVTDNITLDDWLNTYSKYLGEYTKDYIKTYPDLDKVLKELKNLGYILVIVSNKINKEVERGLKLTNLDAYFDYILGADEVEKVKPDPESLNKIKEKYQVDNLLMVGDSPIDIECAINAKVEKVAVAWCKEKIETFDDDIVVINEPHELLDYVKKIDSSL